MSDKMFSNTIEKHGETPDKIEKEENEEFAGAMDLLAQILNDFGASEFTYEDLKDNLPEVSRESLDFLVSKDILIFDEETKEYSVNHNSPYVARIEMNEGPERRVDAPAEN